MKKRHAWFLGAAGVAALVAVLLALPRAAEAEGVERFHHIHGLEIPAWASGEVFVSTHEGLLRIDAMGRWHWVGASRHDFMGFSAHPSEKGVLYSSGHPAPGSGLKNPLGFMVSRDGGKTWQVTALEGQADFHAMAVQRTNGDVVYGWNSAIDPGLYRSLDGGASWSKIDADLMQLGGVYALEVHPEDADVVLAGTRAGLLRSADGGRSWEAFALDGLPVTAVSYLPDGSAGLMAYGAHPEAGLVVTEDDGASWRRLGFVLEGNDAVGYIAVHPEDAGVIYLGSYGQNLYRTTDGGGSWQTLAENGVPKRP